MELEIRVNPHAGVGAGPTAVNLAWKGATKMRLGRRSFLWTAAALGLPWRTNAVATAEPVDQNSTERYPEPLDWKPHLVKRGNNRAGWRLYPADFRFIYRAK